MRDSWGFSHWNMGMVNGVNPFWGEFLGVFLKSSSGLHSNTLCEALFSVFITGSIELGGWVIFG